MNKKLTLALAAMAMTGIVFARPGPGGHHGGRFRRPPAPRHAHHIHRHHHHHHGWGIAAAIGAAAIVRDIVSPAPVVVQPTVVAPAQVVVQPQPPPVVVAPAPVVVNPPAVVYR